MFEVDDQPSRIGRPNKFGVPPAYFDADIEPLVEEYAALFAIMQAPPAGAQASRTPLKDVVDLARAIARARGLDAATADAAGRISLGLFFAETNGNQNIGNARSNTYKGSFQTGVAEDRKGRLAWAAVLPPRDWRLMLTTTAISQVGWWGASIIGFLNVRR